MPPGQSVASNRMGLTILSEVSAGVVRRSEPEPCCFLLVSTATAEPLGPKTTVHAFGKNLSSKVSIDCERSVSSISQWKKPLGGSIPHFERERWLSSFIAPKAFLATPPLRVRFP